MMAWVMSSKSWVENVSPLHTTPGGEGNALFEKQGPSGGFL